MSPKFFLLAILIATVSILFNFSTSSHVIGGNNGSTMMEVKMKPLVSPEMRSIIMLNETRRRLGSFQVCGLCTCCGGHIRKCLPSPCCYAINCNIPNRPFGFCSFTPKACNCFGCSF